MIDTNSSSVLESLEHRDCRLGPQGHWTRRHSRGGCQSRFASSGWRRFHYGASVTRVDNAPCAGTLPVSLTAAGMESPLLKSVAPEPYFHFGNEEQVASVPRAALLLVTSDRAPVAALAYGDHWYSTQFHPEGSAETMGISWAHSKPALCHAYDNSDAGDQVIENFVDLVRQSVNTQS